MVVDSVDSVYWFDGAEWLLVGGRELGHYRLRVRVPERLRYAREPLLVAGRREACNVVYVVQLPDGTAALGFERWGHGGERSLPIRMDPGRDHSLEIQLDRLNRRVVLRFDGHLVLESRANLYPFYEGEVMMGVDRIGCGAVERFSGTIEPVR